MVGTLTIEAQKCAVWRMCGVSLAITMPRVSVKQAWGREALSVRLLPREIAQPQLHKEV
jgi:hypothetical protein